MNCFVRIKKWSLVIYLSYFICCRPTSLPVSPDYCYCCRCCCLFIILLYSFSWFRFSSGYFFSQCLWRFFFLCCFSSILFCFSSFIISCWLERKTEWLCMEFSEWSIIVLLFSVLKLYAHFTIGVNRSAGWRNWFGFIDLLALYCIIYIIYRIHTHKLIMLSIDRKTSNPIGQQQQSFHLGEDKCLSARDEWKIWSNTLSWRFFSNEI